MKVVNISSKGQILIPKALREKHGVTPGSKVLILETQNGLFIKPAPEDPIEAACGFLKGDFSLTQDLIKEHQEELENE
ncbi:MAG: AbrB/MazE/SpoVT family DNA-binding domain-containing protein [Deltaproteobacteria bacterium]|nr:AbrB/MazE/SpoVT family DNA-binding domain-containing protein [Deltaproteobacteria bacterium]